VLSKIVLIVLISSKAFGFLDAIATTGKETAEAAAILGSVSSLLEETNTAAQQVKNLKELQERMEKMNSQLRDINGLSDNTKQLIKGPDYSNVNDLSTNIRYATEYIRTLRKVLLTVGILSPQAQTAINTTTTNNLLNKVVENQNQEAIEREREKADKQRRRINMYSGIKKRLERQKALEKSK
jgi:hypothetical protein